MEIPEDLEKVVELTRVSWEFLKDNREVIEVTTLYSLGIVAGVISLLPIDISPNDRALLRIMLTNFSALGFFRARDYNKNNNE